MTWTLDAVARALLAAEKRGAERERERAAGKADKVAFDAHALEQATEYGRGAHSEAVEIAAAIRKEG